MRIALVAVLAAFLLPGCIAEEPDEPDPLFGLCPQWAAGAGQQAGTVLLDASSPQSSQVFAPADLQQRGHSFDMLRIHVSQMDITQGTLHLRAYNATGAQLQWRDFRAEVPRVVPVLVFAGGNVTDHEFETYLTSVAQDDPPRPTPIELRWTLEGGGTASASFTATFHYKVCGAPA